MVSVVWKLPSGVLKDVPEDGVRHATVVVAQTNVGAPHLVLGAQLLGIVDQLHFTCITSTIDLTQSLYYQIAAKY